MHGAAHPWDVGGEHPSSSSEILKEMEGRQPERGGGEETDRRAGGPGDRGQGRSREPAGAGAPGKKGYLLHGTGLAEAEGKEGRGAPGGRRRTPRQPLRGRGELSPSACGAPPCEAWAADTGMSDTHRNKGEAADGSRSGPRRRFVTHI